MLSIKKIKHYEEKKDFRNTRQDPAKVLEYGLKLYAYKSLDYQVARAIGYRENHNKRKTNLIGALLNNELIAPSFHESNITSDIVFSWVKNTLLPALKRKTLLIMDNASFHKRKDILELMSDAGHMVLYLPPVQS